MLKRLLTLAVAGGTLMLATAIAEAQTYKIGGSLGLTGYAATNDRAWRDGMQIAADYINAKGGVLGKKVELFIEDNRSEPQEAVVGYRKMTMSRFSTAVASLPVTLPLRVSSRAPAFR